MNEIEQNWKTRVIILSTLLGAIIGMLTGYLLSRTAEESGGQPPKISTTDAIKSTVGIIGIVRGIASLGNRK